MEEERWMLSAPIELKVQWLALKKGKFQDFPALLSVPPLKKFFTIALISTVCTKSLITNNKYKFKKGMW